MTAVEDVLFFLIRNRPGLTERELAEATFGTESGYQRSLAEESATESQDAKE